MKRLIYFIFLFAFLFGFASASFCKQVGQEKEKTVKAILFYSSHCGACMYIEENYLPKVFKKYGDKFQLLQKEISDKENFEQLLVINDRGSVPTMKIGDIVLIGRDKIERELEPIIDALLKGETPVLTNEKEQIVIPVKKKQ